MLTNERLRAEYLSCAQQLSDFIRVKIPRLAEEIQPTAAEIQVYYRFGNRLNLWVIFIDFFILFFCLNIT